MKKEKSCGAIILKKENNIIETLILKHNGGHWAFAKGHVEGNETEEETALREIKEETNLEVELDTNFKTTVTYSPSEGIEKDVIYFIAYKTEGKENAQLEEIAELKWCRIDEAIEQVTYDNDKEILRKVKKYLNRI
jgi:8-oxo-dGTP pyrophosphatase MutT (NUDIX family)